MKRSIAAILSIALMLAASGCTKLEQEHFDKSMGYDQTGTAEIEAQLTYTIDPDVFMRAAFAIADSGEEYDEDALDDMRLYLNEDKKCVVTFYEKAVTDFDKNYSDVDVSAGINGITLNCGKVYSRGDVAYYDKRFAYTMGTISFFTAGSDFYDLGDYYTKLDEIFGDKQYLRISMKSAKGGTSNMKELGKGYYNNAKTLLNGYEPNLVTKIPNGTRFEISSKNLTSVSKDFFKHIKNKKTETAEFVNDYLDTSLALGADLAGDEASYMLEMARLFEVSPSDIVESATSANEFLNSGEYKAFIDNFDFSLVNDITEKDGILTSEAEFSLSSNDKNAVYMKALQTTTPVKKAEFDKIDESSCIDYMKFVQDIAEFEPYPDYEGGFSDEELPFYGGYEEEDYLPESDNIG